MLVSGVYHHCYLKTFQQGLKKSFGRIQISLTKTTQSKIPLGVGFRHVLFLHLFGVAWSNLTIFQMGWDSTTSDRKIQSFQSTSAQEYQLLSLEEERRKVNGKAGASVVSTAELKRFLHRLQEVVAWQVHRVLRNFLNNPFKKATMAAMYIYIYL